MKTLDPKSSASANSATPAYCFVLGFCTISIILHNCGFVKGILFKNLFFWLNADGVYKEG